MKNRYEDILIDDALDDDETEWARWSGLTEIEQEQECQEAYQDLEVWLSRLTSRELYRHRRRANLSFCISARNIRKMGYLEIGNDFLKRSQERLWMLRYARQTGIMPGSA